MGEFQSFSIPIVLFSVCFFLLLIEVNFRIAEKVVLRKTISWKLFLLSFLSISLILSLIVLVIISKTSDARFLLAAMYKVLPTFSAVCIGIGMWLTTYVVYKKKAWIETSLKDEKQGFLQHSFNALKSQNVIEFLKDALESTKELIQKDEEKSVIQLEKLTTVLRYLLQSRNERFVELGKELEIVLEYCKLAEIQIGKDVDLFIEVDKEFNATRVPPLVFQMILDHQFHIFKKCEMDNLEIEVYVENRNFVVVKTSLVDDDVIIAQNNNRFINNLKERYRLYSNTADVSILSTTQHYFVKFPLLAG